MSSRLHGALWRSLPKLQRLKSPLAPLSTIGTTMGRCLSSNATEFGSTSSLLKVDPGTLVQGVTKEQMESDPVLTEYMMANFPDAFHEVEVELEDGEFDVESIDFDNIPGYTNRRAKKKRNINPLKDVVYPRNIRPITTYFRCQERDDGTRNSKKLRYHQNLIPGILYGSDPNKNVFMHQKESRTLIKTRWPDLQRELNLYHRAFESRVYDLTVLQDQNDTEGEVHRVTPRNVDRHPVLETIYCANFLRYHPKRPLKIPFKFLNQEESPTLKRDGFILTVARNVEVVVDDGVDIPEWIGIECTGLKAKQVLRDERMILPDGVHLTANMKKKLERGDFVVGIVQGKYRSTEPTPDVEPGPAKIDDKADSKGKAAAAKA